MKHINILVFVTFFSLVSVKVFELIKISKKKDAILTEMKNREAVLANTVQSCELICSIKNRKPNYSYFNSQDISQSNDEYWVRKNNLIYLNDKFEFLRNSNGFGNSARLFKDQISNKVYLGFEIYLLALCNAQTIRINNKTVSHKKNQIYKASMSEDIEIEHDVYTLNFIEGKIDTLKVIRFY